MLGKVAASKRSQADDRAIYATALYAGLRLGPAQILGQTPGHRLGRNMFPGHLSGSTGTAFAKRSVMASTMRAEGRSARSATMRTASAEGAS